MDQINVGKKIREVRKMHKDTLKELSEKINYDLSNLSKVERGKYAATVELLNKIIKVYKLSPTYFFGNDFTKSESELLLEENLELSDLKDKYSFVVDGVSATDDEIIEAIRLIRYLREEK